MRKFKRRSDEIDRFFKDQVVSSIESEYTLRVYIIKNRHEIDIIKNYPYIYDYEYYVFPPYSQYGMGDLIFTNGEEKYLIVELKYLTQRSGKTARTSRRKHRNKVLEQAFSYGTIFKRHNPGANVSALAVTNENLAYRFFQIT